MRILGRVVDACVIAAVLVSTTGCAVFSGDREVPISEMAKAEFRDFRIYPHIPLYLVNRANGNSATFFVAFDGTLNNKENTPAGEDQTVVAKLFNAINFPSIEPGVELHGLQAKLYKKGPGCLFGIWCAFDAATGHSSLDTALDALSALEGFARQLPAGTEVKIVVTGFSRGAATARHFLNLVYHSASTGLLKGLTSGTRSFAILFDTVATGQSERLQLAFPENLELAIHYVAKNESRPLFAPVIDSDEDFERVAVDADLDPPKRVWTIPTPGSHSDLGDSYLRGAGPLVTAHVQGILVSMGLLEPRKIDLCKDDLAATDSGCRTTDEGLHDSRGMIDRLIGAKSPYSCNFVRVASNVVQSSIGAETAFRLALRIRNKRIEDFPSGRGSVIHTRTTSSYVFAADLNSSIWKVLSPELGGYIGHDAVVKYDGDGVLLTLTDPHNKGKSFPVPPQVLNELIRQGGSAQVEMNLNKKGPIWWFVEDCIPSES